MLNEMRLKFCGIEDILLKTLPRYFIVPKVVFGMKSRKKG
jgi:hypothetical protein